MDGLRALLERAKLAVQFQAARDLVPAIPAPECIELLLALEALTMVLDRYAWHDDGCTAPSGAPCDCGFDTAYDSARDYLLSEDAR
jgi:hypothetical protein